MLRLPVDDRVNVRPVTTAVERGSDSAASLPPCGLLEDLE